jgi:hypothetical protein
MLSGCINQGCDMSNTRSPLYGLTQSQLEDRYQYKVEKNVPCPQKSCIGPNSARRGNFYPFRVMAVGDSFFVPAVDMLDNRAPQYAIAQSINQFHQSHVERFTWRTRRLLDHGEEGWRVWRLK